MPDVPRAPAQDEWTTVEHDGWEKPAPWKPKRRGRDTYGEDMSESRTASAMANVFRAMKIEAVAQAHRGDVHATIVWDADDDTFKGKPSGQVKHWVNTFVKGQATMKEGALGDLGTIGRVAFLEFDPMAGLAEVRFQTSRDRIGAGDISIRASDL